MEGWIKILISGIITFLCGLALWKVKNNWDYQQEMFQKIDNLERTKADKMEVNKKIDDLKQSLENAMNQNINQDNIKHSMILDLIKSMDSKIDILLHQKN